MIRDDYVQPLKFRSVFSTVACSPWQIGVSNTIASIYALFFKKKKNQLSSILPTINLDNCMWALLNSNMNNFSNSLIFFFFLGKW